MEDLNKNQIILLTLLVSFITSIATGIVTVSLFDQAPQGVTRTINRVVERTVERVVPGETESIIKEVPVIVTEEELIVKAINLVSPTVFRLMKKVDNKNELVGSVVYLDSGGYFATALPLASNFSQGDYLIVNEDGQEFRATEVARGTQILLLRIIDSRREEFNNLNQGIKPLVSVSDPLNVGQTVIGVGTTPSGGHTVAVSIVSSLSSANATSTSMTTNAATLENLGGPLVNIQGRAMGINFSIGKTISIREAMSLLDSVK